MSQLAIISDDPENPADSYAQVTWGSFDIPLRAASVTYQVTFEKWAPFIGEYLVYYNFQLQLFWSGDTLVGMTAWDGFIGTGGRELWRLSNMLAFRQYVESYNFTGDESWLVDTPAQRSGTEGADTIVGGVHQNLFLGLGGNDLLQGLANTDTLAGGAGDDTLVGGTSVDVLDGGAGFDLVDYGSEYVVGTGHGVSVNLLTADPAAMSYARDTTGSYDGLLGVEGVIGTALGDILYGSNGANLFRGGDGADIVVAWDGADTVDGGSGDDVLLGWFGDDSLLGGSGADWLWAGDGNDTAWGEDGADVLVGDLPGLAETGADLLLGGLGDDTLLGGAGADTLLGGLDTSPGFQPAARDWFVGGAGDDLVVAGGGNDVLWEALDANEGGADTLLAGDGNDLLLGGSGNDSLVGGAGDDSLYGGPGADTIAGGPGADTLWIETSAEFGDVVSDFGTDDRIAIQNLLGAGMTTLAAFALGILSLSAVGANSVLRYDPDGSGPAPSLVVATFLGVAPTDLIVA